MLGLGNTTPYMYSITPVFTNDFSISLDGTDDFIDADVVNNGISGWEDIYEQGSISVWVKVEPTSSTGTIVRLQLDSNNFISLYYHAGSNETRAAWKADGSGSVSTTVASDNPAIEDSGNFHHIVCTWAQAGKINLYVDGSLLDTQPGGATRLPAWNTTGGDIDNIAIGQDTNGSSYFNGNVSNFSLWSKELSASAVSLIYNSGTPNDLNSNGLTAPTSWYRFEEGSGTTMNDTNGSNNGTLINGTTYSTDVPT